MNNIVTDSRHKNSYHTFLQFMEGGEKMKCIHKWLVELTSEVRKFAYDFRLPITVRSKSDYKVLQHDYVILNIGKIKQQMNLSAVEVK